MKIYMIGFALLLGYCSNSASAQKNSAYHWPPAPFIDLKDNYSPRERKILRKPDGTPYYAFTEQKNALDDNLSYLSELRTPFEHQMGRNVFQLLAPQDQDRTFMFVPHRNPFSIFNLQHTRRGEDKSSSQTSYVTHERWASFHSPSFSPNGKSVLIQDGYPPGDMDYGSGFFIWEQGSGRLRWMDNQATLLNRILWSPGSRFLSYTHGGKVYRSPNAGDPDPYELWCMDVPSRREHLIVKNPGLDWSWTYHGKILYSALLPVVEGGIEKRARSAIYEVSAQGGPAHKLFERGFSPLESPNGRWIAFYDWPDQWYQRSSLFDQQKVGPDTIQPRLCLFDRKTRKRRWVGILNVATQVSDFGETLQMQWSLDGRSLFILTDFSDTSLPRSATLYRMNASSQTLSLVTTLEADDSHGRARLRLRNLSSDGNILYIETITPTVGIPNQYNTYSTLCSVNTKNGITRALARIFNIGNENPAWAFRDNVPLHPTLIAAEKLETALRAKVVSRVPRRR